YQHSARAELPLMVVNCVAIPETLLESELFGHERGAFTGAQLRRIGKFEQAHRGTIFLDEIGDVPLSIQGKILRVLQEKTFDRVGSNEPVRVDVRVLAATNRNLEKGIKDGSFREDLYHRLNVVTIDIPPLRERNGDIDLLTRFFMARFAAELGYKDPILSEQALTALKSHRWPGNVRELEHCIHRALIFTRGFPIHPEDVHQALERPVAAGGADAAAALPPEERCREIIKELIQHAGPEHGYREIIELVDRILITEALRSTNGNQTHAARNLGLTRPTLQAKMQKYKIHRSTQISS
ncbi:MAG: sigma-54 interaction domain-containing protein, partial [Planctomycetota bacterium]